MEKYTKKASARILKEVLKIDSKASGFTTMDQAFVTLMNHWDMYIDVVNSDNSTVCTLYRDDDKPHTWKFKDLWDSKEGDWDWNTIYKTVLEDIIRLKLHKRPKLGKRALKKLEEDKKTKKVEEVEEVVITKATLTKTETPLTITDLRKKRDNLSVKIWDWKKKGKDVTELNKEFESIKEQIKKLAKTK